MFEVELKSTRVHGFGSQVADEDNEDVMSKYVCLKDPIYFILCIKQKDDSIGWR